MSIREFTKKVNGTLASIPVVGLMFKTEDIKPPTPSLYDNKVFNDLVRQKFRSPHPNLPFIERTKIVNADDEEILAYSGYMIRESVGDLIATDEGVIADSRLGRINAIPNIKVGSRVSDSMIILAARLKNEVDKTTSLELINAYREQLAEHVAFGVKQIMNMLVLQVMLGGKANDFHGIKIMVDIPDGLHIEADWSKPFTAINAHKEKMASTFGENIDRMTLKSKTYRLLLASTEFQDAFLKYRKENAARFEEYINIYREKHNGVEPNDYLLIRHFAPTVLSNEVGVFVDLYDAIYRSRSNGQSKVQSVLPENKVLFSNSKNDLNGMSMDYAQALVIESITNLVKESSDHCGIGFGPIGFFRSNFELNPPDAQAWAVTRGRPRLHNRTAFSSFTV
jgi:hypothetical protein